MSNRIDINFRVDIRPPSSHSVDDARLCEAIAELVRVIYGNETESVVQQGTLSIVLSVEARR